MKTLGQEQGMIRFSSWTSECGMEKTIRNQDRGRQSSWAAVAIIQLRDCVGLIRAMVLGTERMNGIGSRDLKKKG